MGQPEGREPLNSRVQRTVSPLGWRLAADAAHLEPVQFRRPLHVCGGNLAGSRPALAADVGAVSGPAAPDGDAASAEVEPHPLS